MPSVRKAERVRRAERESLLAERAATVTTAYPDLNRHYALQLALDYRLWGEDEGWREAAANSNVPPCLLSCCNH